MANLEHADLPLNQAGCTALMALMRFYQESDYDPMAEDYPGYLLPHDCRCEPELLDFENGHLSKMGQPAPCSWSQMEHPAPQRRVVSSRGTEGFVE